jgi:hypothetical protein
MNNLIGILNKLKPSISKKNAEPIITHNIPYFFEYSFL